MADSSSEEKTEKPSAQKLRKAREEGQLPRSKDMGLAASLFAAFVVISSSFPWYADFVRESFISVHQYAQEINNPQVIGQFLRHHLLILGKFILTLLPMPAAALLSSLVPGGWLLLEHGWTQGAAVRALFSAAGYASVETCRDYGGNERLTLGKKP